MVLPPTYVLILTTTINVDNTNNIQSVTISIKGVIVNNTYKPPQTIWPDVPFEIYPHPCIYVGDFNSHSTFWGYANCDLNGNKLFEWMQLNQLYLVHNLKDNGTFRSAVHRADYNPDLCFISTSPLDPICVNRQVLHAFPHSQHKPVIKEYGLSICAKYFVCAKKEVEL